MAYLGPSWRPLEPPKTNLEPSWPPRGGDDVRDGVPNLGDDVHHGGPCFYEKNGSPGDLRFWTPKWAPKWVRELLKSASNFGPVFGPISGSLLGQFWGSPGAQDWLGRRPEGPTRAN